MDHLLRPKDPAFLNPKVPHVADTYDRGDLLSYLSRIGRTKTSGVASAEALFIQEQRNPTSTELFEVLIQTWLFFGLLHAHLGPLDLYDESDYIEDGCVHTKCLIKRLTQWGQTMAAFEPKVRTCFADYLATCLETAWRALMVVGGDSSRMHPDFNTAIRSSIYALLDILINVRLHYLKADGFLAQPTDDSDTIKRSTEQKLLKLGWCPSELRLRDNLLTTYGAKHFVEGLRHVNLQQDHGGCDTTYCVHLTTDLETYTPRHVDAGCHCQLVGPEPETVADILRSGTYPILTITDDAKDDLAMVRVSVKPWCAKDRYVAVSHVWADGLGNPARCGLPQCQVRHLANILKRLDAQIRPWVAGRQTCLSTQTLSTVAGRLLYKPHLHLWIDTLCVPVVNDETSHEQRQLKDRGINLLREVYSNATQVLILDRYLTGLRLDDIGMIEAGFRLILSQWMRRLWCTSQSSARELADSATGFQEAALASRPSVQFADRTVPIDALLDAVTSPKHEAEFTSYMMRRELFARLIALRLFHPAFWNKPDVTDVTFVSEAVRHRGVSVATDEALCLAPLLEIPLHKITEGPKDERMLAIWRNITDDVGGIPSGIIFVRHEEREHATEFRWAPKSLRSEHAGRLAPRTRGTLTPQGLQVKFPAWRISCAGRPSWLDHDIEERFGAKSMYLRTGDIWQMLGTPKELQEHLTSDVMLSISRRSSPYYIIRASEPRLRSQKALFGLSPGTMHDATIIQSIVATSLVEVSDWQSECRTDLEECAQELLAQHGDLDKQGVQYSSDGLRRLLLTKAENLVRRDWCTNYYAKALPNYYAVLGSVYRELVDHYLGRSVLLIEETFDAAAQWIID